MMRFIKSTTMVIAGLCWLAFAGFFCVFLYHYLVGGAGLQVFGFFLPVSSTTGLFGLVHFVGFVAAACLCFVIGAALFAYGTAPLQERADQKEELSDETDDAAGQLDGSGNCQRLLQPTRRFWRRSRSLI